MFQILREFACGVYFNYTAEIYKLDELKLLSELFCQRGHHARHCPNELHPDSTDPRAVAFGGRWPGESTGDSKSEAATNVASMQRQKLYTERKLFKILMSF